MHLASDRRRHRRIEFTEAVSVSWTIGSGGKEQTRARGLDISTYGMSIECDVPIAPDTQVLLDVPLYAFSGKAVVVRCLPTGKRFKIGLHFDSVLSIYIDVRRQFSGRLTS